MKHLLILVLSIDLIVAQSVKQSIETDINQIVKATNTPGAAVAIVFHDSIFLCKGFGYKNLEDQLNVNQNTTFAIGSSTKAFTASLIGIAENYDSISIDDSPKRYLEKLSFHTEDMNRNITIRDLLSHRTGLPRHDLSWYLFPEQEGDVLLERIRHLEPFSAVRQQYHYNNFGYLILGRLAEQTLGAEWNRLIKKFIFSPLEMNNSHTSVNANKNEDRATGYSTSPQGKSTVMNYYDIAGMKAAGAIYSSVSDMTKWVQCWLNSGTFNNTQVLPKDYVIEAISSQAVMRAALPDEEFKNLFFSNYGFGWMLSSYKGHYRVEHGGNINGFSANVCFFPAESLGIVVLTNQNNSDAPYLIRNTISDYLLNSQKTDWLAYHNKNKGEIPTEQQKTQKEIQKFNPEPIIEGNYINKGYGQIKIQKKQNELFVIFPVGMFRLTRTNETQFQLLTEGNRKNIDQGTVPELLFNMDFASDGTFNGISVAMEPNLEPIPFLKEK
ncbi:MAG: serine hydrolase domain-containing protein [Croceivirga sp.]